MKVNEQYFPVILFESEEMIVAVKAIYTIA